MYLSQYYTLWPSKNYLLVSFLSFWSLAFACQLYCKYFFFWEQEAFVFFLALCTVSLWLCSHIFFHGNPIYFSFSLFFLIIWQSLNSTGFSHTCPLLYFHKSGTIWTSTFKITCWKLPVPPPSFPIRLTSQIPVFAYCLLICCLLFCSLGSFLTSSELCQFTVILIHVVFSPHSTREFLLAGICPEKGLPQIFSLSFVLKSSHRLVLRNCWTSYPCSTLYPQSKPSIASG